jgi:hypothetical protein
MIASKYINWTDATIRAIKCYEDMQYCLDTAQASIDAINDRMTSPKGSNLSKQPVSGGGSQIEDAWISGIDRKQAVADKLSEAQRYMAWFKPAWERLAEEERIILEESYIKRGERPWTEHAANRLHCSVPELYRRRNEALERMKMLLYGG